jgi:hypothetical protein
MSSTRAPDDDFPQDLGVEETMSIPFDDTDETEEEMDASYFTNWRYINTDDIPVTISRDAIHSWLLNLARKEMATVAQRILKRLGENEATPFNICDIVVAPLLGVLREAMVIVGHMVPKAFEENYCDAARFPERG